VAKQTRQGKPNGPRKTVKVQAEIDASLYARLAAGAALRQVSHSTYVADALDAALRDQGVVVVQRRVAGSGDLPDTVGGSAESAA
jgi:hypothetical protein